MRRETAGGAGRDETRCAPMLSTLALVFKSLALRAGSLQRLRNHVAPRSSRPGSRRSAASTARTRWALSGSAGPRRGSDGGGDGARRAGTDQPNVDYGFTAGWCPGRVVGPAGPGGRQASRWLTAGTPIRWTAQRANAAAGAALPLVVQVASERAIKRGAGDGSSRQGAAVSPCAPARRPKQASRATEPRRSLVEEGERCGAAVGRLRCLSLACRSDGRPPRGLTAGRP
jgi:hypothetical protein